MIKQKPVIRRKRRVRLHIAEVSSRVRLSVIRSNIHITAILIDDSKGQTLATASDALLKGTKTERAAMVGTAIAKLGDKLKIKEVVYDRGGYRYHGRVKALAEAARAGGLAF
jgi:large subunit ribosomal protein L18